ncbi:MAG: hypothetical protein ACW98F_15770 [Candidatus Hodarchaeales archaeon]
MRANNGTTLLVNLVSTYHPLQGDGFFPFLSKDRDFSQTEFNFGGKDTEWEFSLGVIIHSFLVYLCGWITHIENPKNDGYIKSSFVGFLAILKFLPIMSPQTNDGNSSFSKISTYIPLTVGINGKCRRFLRYS